MKDPKNIEEETKEGMVDEKERPQVFKKEPKYIPDDLPLFRGHHICLNKEFVASFKAKYQESPTIM